MGALVVVNAVGAAFGPTGGCSRRHLAIGEDLPTPDAGRVAAHWAAVANETERLRAGSATTLAVVATDVTLTKAGCQKLAGVGHDGLARALSPVHTAYDGDTVFALATGERPAVTGVDEVELQTAAADCVVAGHRAGRARSDVGRPHGRRRRGAAVVPRRPGGPLIAASADAVALATVSALAPSSRAAPAQPE